MIYVCKLPELPFSIELKTTPFKKTIRMNVMDTIFNRQTVGMDTTAAIEKGHL